MLTGCSAAIATQFDGLITAASFEVDEQCYIANQHDDREYCNVREGTLLGYLDLFLDLSGVIQRLHFFVVCGSVTAQQIGLIF